MPRAIVIGGGVIGLTCAIELRRRGMDVVVIEAEPMPRGASWGNAGHIAVEQVEPLASIATLRSFPARLFWRGGALGLPLGAWRAWLPFALRMVSAARPRRFAAGKRALASMLAHALPAWRRLLEQAGAGALLREQGHFVVWESPASAARRAAHWNAADIGEARVRDMTGDELTEIGALTSAELTGGIRFEGSGQIEDLGLLAETLSAQLERIGGARRIGKAVSIAKDGSGATVQLADGEVVAGDIVVLAVGAASAPLLRPHGCRVPLIAERGYHIQSAVDADWPMGTPPVVFEDRSIIVTRFRSGLRAASFVEFAPAAHPADPRKWARLRGHATALGLPIAPDASEWMGARPTLPDYLPAIGRCVGFPELLYAFGHQHLGLTLAACTAEAVGALAAGEAAPFDLAPFDIARFG